MDISIHFLRRHFSRRQAGGAPAPQRGAGRTPQPNDKSVIKNYQKSESIVRLIISFWTSWHSSTKKAE